MDLIKPEKLTLTVCQWVKLHAERHEGNFSYLKMGKSKYALIDFQFEQWHFPTPSVQFFLEFTKLFQDRTIVINEVVCPDCRREIDRKLNTEIIEAQGIPPTED